MNEHPLLAGHTHCVLFVVIGETFGKVQIYNEKIIHARQSFKPLASGVGDGIRKRKVTVKSSSIRTGDRVFYLYKYVISKDAVKLKLYVCVIEHHPMTPSPPPDQDVEDSEIFPFFWTCQFFFISLSHTQENQIIVCSPLQNLYPITW